MAVDLPGHGHSDWRDDGRYGPVENAEAVAGAIRELAPEAAAVIGMSLGGITTIALASRHPDLVRKAVIVDVTPGTDHMKAAPIVAFIDGPETFESFDEILQRTIQFNPTRSESSLRRGVLHNAHARDDGTWVFPGGRVDEADDHADEEVAARNAAVREAQEEAGLDVDPADLVAFAHWTPPAVSDMKRFSTWFFLAEAPAGAVVIDNGEI